MHFRGFGVGPPEISEFIKNFTEKSMQTWNFKKFKYHERIVYFQKPLEIKIKVGLMFYWKSLVTLKVIRKPSGKFLRVWAKNQLRVEIFEKIFKFQYVNISKSQWKIDFLSMLICKNLCHFIQLSNINHFSSTFFRFRCDNPLPSAGALEHSLYSYEVENF